MMSPRSLDEELTLRRSYIEKVRRVVVKVGSAMLTQADGLNRQVMENLAASLVWLQQTGREVILVSSGAVASGKKRLGEVWRGGGLKEKQAAAAIGQSLLMGTYEEVFTPFSQTIAQVLLTHADLSQRERYLNIRNTLFTLLQWRVLPIINENDTVSVKELRFGDNDTLAAMVANLIEADLLVCLTDVDGLFTGNPATDPQARLLHTVDIIDGKVEAMAGKVVGLLGTGGMQSKIRAAKMVAARGGASFIGPGRRGNVLQSLFAGEEVGTFIMPQAAKMQSRKHWIAYTLRPKGQLHLDDGACRALVHCGKSLLPSGIREVEGQFRIGDPVHCLDRHGRAVAAGLVNFSADDVRKIQGAKTHQIKEILGYCDSDEVIHRDNLVILE